MGKGILKVIKLIFSSGSILRYGPNRSKESFKFVIDL